MLFLQKKPLHKGYKMAFGTRFIASTVLALRDETPSKDLGVGDNNHDKTTGRKNFKQMKEKGLENCL